MTEQAHDSTSVDPAERVAALERELAETRSTSQARLVRAELKAEAVRAGILDLDGLKLLDTSGLTLTPEGALENGSDVIARLKRDKPWMFTKPSSSNHQPAPTPEPPKTRTAQDMSYSEWQTAREKLIRGR